MLHLRTGNACEKTGWKVLRFVERFSVDFINAHEELHEISHR